MNLNNYPANWASIRKQVLNRDKYIYQHCGAAHHELKRSERGRVFKVFLQVAHLDHDPENHKVSLDRLLSLCQPCHLKNDREHSLSVLQKRGYTEKATKTGTSKVSLKM